ncbi:hypothetical protein GCM10022384_18380 [Streptomyces marokkonensis]|uniref:Uncharacterized protein n=1 Tax=Streptomyces marokkonensis TaxID=324855 RepID=A0ABP7PKW4_9ACTN
MGSVPRTVLFRRSRGAAEAKLTLPDVSAAAAPVTNTARLPIPAWSSSHMLLLPGVVSDMTSVVRAWCRGGAWDGSGGRGGWYVQPSY